MIFYRLQALCVSLVALVATAQTKVIDAETNKPIAFVEIYTDKGNLIGTSDTGGLLTPVLVGSISKSSTRKLSFNHMAYRELIVTKDVFLNSEVIKLIPNVRLLDEVVVTGKKTKSYIKLNGYYRSYQIEDDRLAYFSDGMMGYLFLSAKNSQTGLFRLEERSFRAREKSTDGKEKTVKIVMNVTGPGYIDIGLSLPDLEDKFRVRKTTQDIYELLSKEGNAKKGIIAINKPNNSTTYEIGYTTQGEQTVKKAFGYENITEYHYEQSVVNDTMLGNVSPSRLRFLRIIKDLRFKHNGDTAYQNIKSVFEFIVTDVEFLSAKPKNYSTFTGFRKESSYTTTYWKEITKHPLYTPLPYGVDAALQSDLVELENIRK